MGSLVPAQIPSLSFPLTEPRAFAFFAKKRPERAVPFLKTAARSASFAPAAVLGCAPCQRTRWGQRVWGGRTYGRRARQGGALPSGGSAIRGSAAHFCQHTTAIRGGGYWGQRTVAHTHTHTHTISLTRRTKWPGERELDVGWATIEPEILTCDNWWRG